jgi:hypothetical protein
MMRAWQCKLRVTQHEAKLLLNSPEPGDLLKARLDPRLRAAAARAAAHGQ